MNSVKQFTRQPFDVKFAQARQHIYEYLELGREAQSRTHRRIAEQKASQQANKITPAKKKPKWVCHEIALELDMSYSFIHQAKKTAQQFTDKQAECFLQACEDAKYLPSREIFGVLSRVPVASRPEWIKKLLQHHWTATQLKSECQRAYGKRSKGGRKPKKPGTLQESQAQFAREELRLRAIFQRLHEVQEGVSERPQGVNFSVPRELMSKVRSCLKALDGVSEALMSVA